MLKLSIQIISGLLFIAASASADERPIREGPVTTPVCREIVGGVYWPFNTVRKFKLASAYFVNPSLPEKSKILSGYLLADFVNKKKTTELWTALNKGRLNLSVPVAEEEGAFVAISAKDATSFKGACGLTAGVTLMIKGSKIAVYPDYYKNLDFHNKENFQAWLSKLKPEDLESIRFVAGQEIPVGIESSERYISWDPAEVVTFVRMQPTQ